MISLNQYISGLGGAFRRGPEEVVLLSCAWNTSRNVLPSDAQQQTCIRVRRKKLYRSFGTGMMSRERKWKNLPVAPYLFCGFMVDSSSAASSSLAGLKRDQECQHVEATAVTGNKYEKRVEEWEASGLQRSLRRRGGRTSLLELSHIVTLSL